MNDLCINWIEEQNDTLLNVKVNDAYDNYNHIARRIIYHMWLEEHLSTS